jgi:hypothetical protein
MIYDRFLKSLPEALIAPWRTENRQHSEFREDHCLCGNRSLLAYFGG